LVASASAIEQLGNSLAAEVALKGRIVGILTSPRVDYTVVRRLLYWRCETDQDFPNALNVMREIRSALVR
jgi:hypothetical protein